MNILKAYNSYMSNAYKMVTYIIYPLVIISGIVIAYALDCDIVFCVALLSSVCLFAEIVIDYIMFSGILSKSITPLEYIKSSSKGRAYYKKVVIAAEIRRFIYYAIFFGIVFLVGYLYDFDIVKEKEFLKVEVFYIATSYLIMICAIFVARFFTSFTIYFFIGYFPSIASSVIFKSISKYLDKYNVDNLFLVSGIEIILCIVVTIVMIKIIYKKMEGSYYDAGSKVRA